METELDAALILPLLPLYLCESAIWRMVHMAGCMGFLWVNGFSFFHCVASPFHSFVTPYGACRLVALAVRECDFVSFPTL